VEKKFSNTNKHAPTRRQIDDYVAARNRDFETKIENLKKNITAIKFKIREFDEKKSIIKQRSHINYLSLLGISEAQTKLDTLKANESEAKFSLLAVKSELRSLEKKSNYKFIQIKQVEQKLDGLKNRLFKKQERDECTVQLAELKKQQELVESQKRIHSDSQTALYNLISNLDEQINLQSKALRDAKTFQALQEKIDIKKNLLSTKSKLLTDLETKFNEAKLLEEPSLSTMALKHAVRQQQISERKKKEAKKKLEKRKIAREAKLTAERRKQQAETQVLVRRLRRLENFVDENPLTQLEKELSAAVSVVQRLERKRISVEGSIDRWIESKFYRKGESTKQILGELKSRGRLKNYLPLYNLVAKKDELKVLIQQKQTLVSAIKQRLQKVNECSAQIADINSELSRLEREAMSHIGRHRQPLPRMDIENWSDAELFAEKYMKWLGFADAKRTGEGADEGKDVDSRKAIAQVKDMGTGASRPMLQQLNGVAAAERKIPIFFARSYATTAKEWGEKHGIALFQFTLRGEVKAISKKAKELLEGV